MRLRTLVATLAILTLVSSVAYAASRFSATASEFDPGNTFLVQAQWLDGIGCPTSARIAVPNADFTGVGSIGSYGDPGCPTGDSSDSHNQGLLLVKTGPTANFAAAQADINGVRGIHLTELGYDIRKPRTFADLSGSQCGAGAPRFDVITSDNVDHFVGCTSPTPGQTTVGVGWIRLRYNPTLAFPPILPTDTVKSITIIFDEGQDIAPDNFGLAVLDNIDINGTLIGQGDNAGNNGNKKDRNKDNNKGDDGDNNDQGEND
jgi:hypothetical protein